MVTMSTRPTGIEALTSLTELDVQAMSDEEVKQTLMDLRGLPTARRFELINLFRGLDDTPNEQIARLSREEAATMLLDLRDIALRHI